MSVMKKVFKIGKKVVKWYADTASQNYAWTPTGAIPQVVYGEF